MVAGRTARDRHPDVRHHDRDRRLHRRRSGEPQLLRAADARVPGARHRAGLRPADRGEDQRRGAAAGGAVAGAVGRHHIAMGTNTDPYQRAEGRYRLTRSIIEVLGEAANPFSILTKSSLVLRDLDLLVAARERTDVGSTCRSAPSTPTCGGPPNPAHRTRPDGSRRSPRSTRPASRGVLVAPILPGLSDGREQLEAVATACVEAGGVRVGDPAPPPPWREAALPRDAAGIAPRRGRGHRAPLPAGQRGQGEPRRLRDRARSRAPGRRVQRGPGQRPPHRPRAPDPGARTRPAPRPRASSV